MIESPSLLLTIGAFLLLLGPLIVLHELGHYYAGRLFGVRAQTFSVGIGKELWHRIDKRGTRWRIAAIPLGGYVLFAGDADASSKPDPALEGASAEELKGTFPGAPLWQRALIVLAGPFANLLVAAAIYFGIALSYGVPYHPPVVAEFSVNSAAQQAGIQIGDRIVAIDDARINDFTDIAPRVALYPGQQVTVTVDRAGRTLDFPVRIALYKEKDSFGNETERGLLGVAYAQGEMRSIGPVGAAGFAVSTTADGFRFIAVGLKQIVFGERSLKEMGGLPKTAKVSGEMLTLGWGVFLGFAAFVSINLAFINLLPIPTLDGGHLAFYAAEAVRRKPLGVRSQEFAFRIGMAFVIAVALFVNVNDLVTLFLK